MIDITLPEQDFISESISQSTSTLLDAFQVEKETKFLSEGITEDNDDVSEGITIGHDLLGRPVLEGDDADVRVIDTGLTKDEDLEVLQSVMGQLSDGIFENSRAMEHFWPFADVAKENGKVVLKIKKTSSSSIVRNPRNDFIGMSDDKVKEWFANKVKAVVKEEGLLWKRENTNKLDYMGGHTCDVNVRDAYRVYDKLKGRRDYIQDSESEVSEDDKKFSKEQIEEALSYWKSVLEEILAAENK